MQSVGERVRKLRREAELSREQLAVRAGCASSTLGRLERDDVVPNLTILANVADELGTTVSDLLAEKVAS